MIKKRDLKILTHLRVNARQKLTDISKNTGIPVSTIFDRIRHNENSVIKKHTSLLDFSKLGYQTRVNILLKTKKEQREKLNGFLSNHSSINSAFKINQDFDFLIDCVFSNMKELEYFLEDLEEKFNIEKKQVHHVIEDIKLESFLSNLD